jgi:DNA-binding CsgD family transcriptional regulator
VEFVNIWTFDNLLTLELLTLKIPLYNSNGKISGIFGISQYINKFSSTKAFELGLSKRETECLFHLLEGKSNKQVAKLLNISVRTVEDYLNNVKNKLGCFSKEELIFKAIKSGILDSVRENFNALNKEIVNSKQLHSTEVNNRENVRINGKIFVSTQQSLGSSLIIP